MNFFRKKKKTLRETYDELKKERDEQPQPLCLNPESGDSLYADLVPMLYCSELIYAFAYLRKKAKDKDTTMKSETLILPAPGEGAKRCEKPIGIENAMEVSDFTKFIENNLESLEDDPEIDYHDAFIIKALFHLEDLQKQSNTYIVGFNGQDEGHTFVYGILVNHDEKRITVVFRGTSVRGDWWANLNAFKRNFNENSDKLKKIEAKGIPVHAGFRKYLLDPEGPPEGPNISQKYDEIKDIIAELYKNGHKVKGKEHKDRACEYYKGGPCEGYELFITGHSLGGALSSLMSFYLATSSTMAPYLELAKKPVVNLTFASPYVGGKVWKEAFHELEKEKKIQHIRVSNHKDMVPSLIALPDYVHVGVNLHLNPTAGNGHELVYGDDGNYKSLWGAWNFKFLEAHELPQYYERLVNIKEHIDAKTIEGIYNNLGIYKKESTS